MRGQTKLLTKLNKALNIRQQATYYKDYFPNQCKLNADHWQHELDFVNNNELGHIKPVTAPWRSSQQKNRRNEVVLCCLRIGHETRPWSLHGEKASALLQGLSRPLICETF